MKKGNRLTIKKSWCLLLGLILITATIMIVPTASASDPWTVTLNFEDTNGRKDTVVFAESSSASEGKDNYDVPKPGLPPEPYLYAWFNASLPIPYTYLWEDYRHYSGDDKVWYLNVTCNTTTPTISDTKINITWSLSEISNTPIVIIPIIRFCRLYV